MNATEAAMFMTHVLVGTEARLALAKAAWIKEILITSDCTSIAGMMSSSAGKGEPGSRLRMLCDAHTQASAAWHAAREGYSEDQ